MSGSLTAGELGLLRAGSDLHMNHYGGRRLPYAVLSGRGVHQRLAVVDGPDAGRVLDVMDASGGYASACLGAGHPRIGEALRRGVEEAGYATDEVGSLERARLLTELFGDDGRWSARFPGGEYHVSSRNSGSEGMELALRLMLEARFDSRTLRPAAGRAERDVILAFEGAWHGWTSGLVPLLNRRHYRVGLPVPDVAKPYGVRVEHLPFGDAEVLRDYFAEHGHRVLGVVVEPVQGDAGILVPADGYLRELARLCTEHGALLTADEILTFAKSGDYFAMTDSLGPVPTDITVIGKSIGMGAVSASLVIARRALAVRSSGAVATSDLRPLTCAVMREGLAVMNDDKLLAHSAGIGRRLADGLHGLVAEFPELYREARGLAVMQGLELTEPAARRLTDLREAVIRSGVYVEFMAGAGRRTRGLRYVFPTMRIAPPLIITEIEASELLQRLAEGSRRFRETLG
ncbi:aminotransferase class III-fold pyridoxal phosphate-dependent enzyme [Couchioplanes azureus]|uniref:aminotransferase class III-fold pyridoxal phosphate-dependent enzyme n=1 Tax=Couchioplanes caeruleus TaxID=56438 RepID=UPI00199C6F44|nr:aminotransferase class III-fold pyridoxal phosphate-dependent enzyme [Couchioplanes caeruleus]GGQ65165.1 acetylornithine aminotransferase [Couchioplanes caeruleus subsp. azureus]